MCAGVRGKKKVTGAWSGGGVQPPGPPSLRNPHLSALGVTAGVGAGVLGRCRWRCGRKPATVGVWWEECVVVNGGGNKGGM